MGIPRGPRGLVVSGSAQIYFECWGDADDTVVLSHGLGGTHAVWYQQVPVLARHFRVITWDQRGFGRSTDGFDSAGPSAAVDDLASVLDHVGIDAAHLVGQSMGGWASLGFALRGPDRVTSLVLADSIAGIYTPMIADHYDSFIATQSEDRPSDRATLGEHFALGMPIQRDRIAQAFLYEQLGGTSPELMRDVRARLRSTSYDKERVRRLDVPTLFVVGDEDVIFPPEVIRDAARFRPGSRVEVMPGAGHSPYFEEPDRWNEIVLSFLREHSAP